MVTPMVTCDRTHQTCPWRLIVSRDLSGDSNWHGGGGSGLTNAGRPKEMNSSQFFSYSRSSQPSHRTNSLPRHVSMMASTMSRQQQQQQQNNNNPEESLQDLSLQSLQWLESRGLYETNIQDSRNPRRASLPEQIQANGYYR